MSDYLGILAARSLGLTPVARPKMASRFEPGGWGARPGPTLTSMGDSIDRTDSPAIAAPPSRLPAHEPNATLLHSSLAAGTFERHSIVATPRLHGDFGIPPAENGTLAAPPADNPGSMERSAAPVAARPHQTVPPAADMWQPAARHATTSEGGREAHAPPADSPDSRWVDVESRLSVLEGAHARPRSPIEPLARAADPPRLAPRMGRRHQPSIVVQASTAPIAAPESARTIQVTIGRVDVQAMAPPEMSPYRRPRPQMPTPSLSLDDYLKSRSGR